MITIRAYSLYKRMKD